MAGTPDPTVDDAGDRAAPETGQRRSVIETWVELFADAGGLVRVEAALARAETARNLKVVGRETAKLVAGFALLLMALVFLAVASVVGLAHFLGYLQALLLVMLICAGGGAGLILIGKSRLAGQTILPERVLNRLARDLDRIAERAPLTPPATPAAPATIDAGVGANAN